MPSRAPTPTLQHRHAEAGRAETRHPATLAAALEDAEARFRRLVEQVPTVTYICDFDEAVSIRYISPQIEGLTGYPPSRWTEDPQFWVSILHPDDHDWVVEEMARRTREEVPVDFEYRFVAGLIEAIGEWVLDATCRQAKRWREAGLEIEVGYNASPLELAAPGFARRVGERMRAHGLGPGTLVVEITESALSEPAAVAPVLDRLAELGVKIAIDDFGAGFSSLTRLRHLTVHILKLDRSFLAGVPEDPRAATFIAAMLRLARELDLHVVAEGIETPAQLAYLRTSEASHGQGFHLARPMPADDFTTLLRA